MNFMFSHNVSFTQKRIKELMLVTSRKTINRIFNVHIILWVIFCKFVDFQTFGQLGFMIIATILLCSGFGIIVTILLIKDLNNPLLSRFSKRVGILMYIFAILLCFFPLYTPFFLHFFGIIK